MAKRRVEGRVCFLGAVNRDAREGQFREVFEQYGAIESIELGWSNGIGFAIFEEGKSAEACSADFQDGKLPCRLRDMPLCQTVKLGNQAGFDAALRNKEVPSNGPSRNRGPGRNSAYSGGGRGGSPKRSSGDFPRPPKPPSPPPELLESEHDSRPWRGGGNRRDREGYRPVLRGRVQAQKAREGSRSPRRDYSPRRSPSRDRRDDSGSPRRIDRSGIGGRRSPSGDDRFSRSPRRERGRSAYRPSRSPDARSRSRSRTPPRRSSPSPRRDRSPAPPSDRGRNRSRSRDARSRSRSANGSRHRSPLSQKSSRGPSPRRSPERSPPREVHRSPPRQRSPTREAHRSPPRERSPTREAHRSPAREKSSNREAHRSPPRERSPTREAHRGPAREKSSNREAHRSPPERSPTREAHRSPPRERSPRRESHRSPPRERCPSRETHRSPPQEKSPPRKPESPRRSPRPQSKGDSPEQAADYHRPRPSSRSRERSRSAATSRHSTKTRKSRSASRESSREKTRLPPSAASNPTTTSAGSTSRPLAPCLLDSSAVTAPPLLPDAVTVAATPPPVHVEPTAETPVLLPPTTATTPAPVRRVEINASRSPPRTVSINNGSKTSAEDRKTRISASFINTTKGSSGGNTQAVVAAATKTSATSSSVQVPNGSAREGRNLTSNGAHNRDDSSSSSSSSYRRKAAAKAATVAAGRLTGLATPQSATPSLASTKEPSRPREKLPVASEKSETSVTLETSVKLATLSPEAPKAAEAPKALPTSPSVEKHTEPSKLVESIQNPPLPAPMRSESSGASAQPVTIASTPMGGSSDPQAGMLVTSAVVTPSWGFGAGGPNANSYVTTASPDDAIVSVALKFQGRRKLIRHSGTTRVGQLLELHPQLMRSGKPQVIVDSQGFEVGNEICLATLCKPGILLELEAKADEW